MKANERIPDPGSSNYDFDHEQMVRSMAERDAAYAESGPTFDPSGKYLCGTCNMREEPVRCTHVSGRISMVAGGCRLYEIGDPMHEKPARQYSQVQAMYA